MAKRSVGFIGLPGGFGTFEEVIIANLVANFSQRLISYLGHGGRNLDPTRYSRQACVTSPKCCQLAGIDQSIAVVMLNVLGFYEPLRQLIQNSIAEGFISSANDGLVIFVDGPASHEEHETFDWGNAAVKAIESWQPQSVTPKFDWSQRLDGTNGNELAST